MGEPLRGWANGSKQYWRNCANRDRDGGANLSCLLVGCNELRQIRAFLWGKCPSAYCSASTYVRISMFLHQCWMKIFGRGWTAWWWRGRNSERSSWSGKSRKNSGHNVLTRPFRGTHLGDGALERKGVVAKLAHEHWTRPWRITAVLQVSPSFQVRMDWWWKIRCDKRTSIPFIRGRSTYAALSRMSPHS